MNHIRSVPVESEHENNHGESDKLQGSPDVGDAQVGHDVKETFRWVLVRII